MFEPLYDTRHCLVLLLNLLLLFRLVCVCFRHACMCTAFMFFGSVGIGLMNDCETLCWCWESNPVLLKEQQMLLTTELSI